MQFLDCLTWAHIETRKPIVWFQKQSQWLRFNTELLIEFFLLPMHVPAIKIDKPSASPQKLDKNVPDICRKQCYILNCALCTFKQQFFFFLTKRINMESTSIVHAHMRVVPRTQMASLCVHPIKIDDSPWNSPNSLMFAFPICPCMMIIRAVNWMIVRYKCRPLSTLICHRNTGNLLVICPVVCGQFSMWHYAFCKYYSARRYFRNHIWRQQLCLNNLFHGEWKKNWNFSSIPK